VSPLVEVRALPQGTPVHFFWDVAANLGTTEREVEVLICADDGVAERRCFEPSIRRFRVDNNDAPQARLFAREFLENPDQRRGIPVPFEVQDLNGHDVRVVFQWSPADEPFPELPSTPAGIEEALQSPALRRQYQIATERPRAFEGRLIAPGPDRDPEGVRVRLMELASTASPLLYGGMVGRELEVLRSSNVPTRVEGSWGLREPVAAAPLDDGIAAVVLDRPAPGSWRLQVVDLGSGKSVRPIASSANGDPRAMALEPGDRSVLLAVDWAGTWRLLRVGLVDSVRDVIFTAGPPLDPGPVRGLALLGAEAALLTAGSSLIRVDFAATGTARASVVLSGLEAPWGIAVDPLDPPLVSLAEHDWRGPGASGRVLALDLNTLERRTIPGFERPESLAFERRGARLAALM